MINRKTFQDIWHRAKEWYNNQPDIRVIQRLPRNQPKPKPFTLKGEMLITDHTERKVGKGGTSSHVTIPPSMVSELSNFDYCGLFQAWGKRGLIYMCKEGSPQ